MAHNKCAKGGRIGGRFLGAAVGGGGRTVLHMGLLNKQKISQVKNKKQFACGAGTVKFERLRLSNTEIVD